MNDVALGFNYNQQEGWLKQYIYDSFVYHCQQNADFIDLFPNENYDEYTSKEFLIRSRTDFMSLDHYDEIKSFTEQKCKEFIEDLKNNPIEKNTIIGIIPKSVRFTDNIDHVDLTYFTLNIHFAII